MDSAMICKEIKWIFMGRGKGRQARDSFLLHHAYKYFQTLFYMRDEIPTIGDLYNGKKRTMMGSMSTSKRLTRVKPIFRRRGNGS